MTQNIVTFHKTTSPLHECQKHISQTTKQPTRKEPTHIHKWNCILLYGSFSDPINRNMEN